MSDQSSSSTIMNQANSSLLASIFNDPEALYKLALNVFDYGVIVYVRPQHIGHVLVSCMSFFIMMIAICYLVERTNPERHEKGRWMQIRAEILESIPAVLASTSVSIFHLNHMYPIRWGFEPPVFPSSIQRYAIEFIYWMACFEVFVYVLHRFLHVRKPIDVYKHIHRAHHLFFFPSAFASQAIHPIEAIMFAETSLIASILFMPISVFTQYSCGILLLTWSIFAHDSRFLLDRGTHYEHHSHPQTNFGFLGFMDLFFNTVYWGPSYDDPTKYPPYVHRWRPLHEWIFGVDPLSATNVLLEKELNEEQKHALAERRRRIMAEKKTT